MYFEEEEDEEDERFRQSFGDEENITIPSRPSRLELMEVDSFPENSSIYFLETNASKAAVKLLHYCAYESAALSNPQKFVFVLVTSENDRLTVGN